MLTTQQVTEFNRNGFLNGGRVVDDAEIGELRSELDRVIRQHEAGAKDGQPRPVMISKWGKDSVVWQVVNIWEASPAYERLLYLKPIVEAISQLTAQPN